MCLFHKVAFHSSSPSAGSYNVSAPFSMMVLNPCRFQCRNIVLLRTNGRIHWVRHFLCEPGILSSISETNVTVEEVKPYQKYVLWTPHMSLGMDSTLHIDHEHICFWLTTIPSRNIIIYAGLFINYFPIMSVWKKPGQFFCEMWGVPQSGQPLRIKILLIIHFLMWAFLKGYKPYNFWPMVTVVDRLRRVGMETDTQKIIR